MQMAIEHGIQYDKCHTEATSKLECILDKAIANVGTIFAEQVEGRVSTEVDPRAAYDTGLACMQVVLAADGVPVAVLTYSNM